MEGRGLTKGNLAGAGGQLLSAAFAFTSAMLAQKEKTEQARLLAGVFRNHLAECFEKGEDGALKMTNTLRDEGVPENLARVLAQMVGSA